MQKGNPNMIYRIKLGPIEGWCGDGSQILPYLAKMAHESNNIQLKILLRDENPEIMDQYLTNGSKSIPKLISVDSEDEEIFTFGKYRGMTVKSVLQENPGYFSWIQNADFPLYTKKVLTAIRLKNFNK